MRPVTLWGVYHANGGLVGELAYVIGKLRGTAHCSLCDITHTIRMKPEWKTLEASLDIPFRLVHLNEQSPELAALTRGSTPCVVGDSEEGLSVLLGPEELEACGGSVGRFRGRLEAALEVASGRGGE